MVRADWHFSSFGRFLPDVLCALRDDLTRAWYDRECTRVEESDLYF